MKTRKGVKLTDEEIRLVKRLQRLAKEKILCAAIWYDGEITYREESEESIQQGIEIDEEGREYKLIPKENF